MSTQQTICIIFLFCFTILSCGQTNIAQKSVEQQTETRYGKVISDSTNKLINKTESLEVEYTLWGCACPNWIQTKDNTNNDTTKNYFKLHFYIEPATKALELPIYFDAFRHRLQITGQFYEREDYPQGTIEGEEKIPKANVFRYTKLEVIDNPNFKPDSKVETLSLSYNAMSCTCAQWADIQKKEEGYINNNYWLEPATANLPLAETFFNGNSLPLIIKVQGQFVTESGFPKRELKKVTQDAAGKVFRYTKIEVVQNGGKKNGR
jgi:hypothetical protein